MGRTDPLWCRDRASRQSHWSHSYVFRPCRPSPCCGLSDARSYAVDGWGEVGGAGNREVDRWLCVRARRGAGAWVEQGNFHDCTARFDYVASWAGVLGRTLRISEA